MKDLLQLFDVAVVIPTVLRKQLKRAVESIYQQTFKGSIQILIGIDKVLGDRKIIDELQDSCPDNIAITVIDFGYSTATRNGGLYTSMAGGSLRTILSYAANSRYVAYLDDDNWYAPYHLSDLLKAIEGKAWAYTSRWYVDMNTNEVICVDNYHSTGPGKGHFARHWGGHVDTNCFLLDKLKCHFILPLWCFALFKDNTCEDLRVFCALMKNNLPYGFTNRPSVYYILDTNRYPGAKQLLIDQGFRIS